MHPSGPTVSETSRGTPTAPPKRFSDDLRALGSQFADRPACLSDILAATQGRGYSLLLLLIALPFTTPIPLPGLSTPFGVVILIIGARLAMGHEPWLPARLLAQQLPPKFVGRVLSAASFAVRWLEILTKPRLDFLHQQWLYRRISGALIMLSGALLLLPLPIPFTNSLPALTVVLLCAGAMERDGLFFLTGVAMAVVSTLYFGLIAAGGVQVFEKLRGWFA